MKKTLATIILGLLAGCSNSQKTHNELNAIRQQKEKITIASFNIQDFGQSKSQKPDVMEILCEIVNDYDICAIQEVSDKTEKTIPNFIQKLGQDYTHITCERVGRGEKEQYSFVYNTKTVEYLGKSYTYSDEDDVFAREPFIAYFKSGNFDFVLINIHTQPSNAASEINALDEVVLDARKKFPNEKDFIVLGDYNADGNYFDEDGKCELKKKEYTWIIPNNADTTVATSSNTYDRLVVTTGCLEDYAHKWDVRNFQKEFQLSPEKTKEVSDHYPIWAMFYRNKDTD